MRGADLSRANLASANLTSSRLIDAILIDANLDSANLMFASMLRADLSRANLASANLTDASFEGANLDSTSFSNARWDISICVPGPSFLLCTPMPDFTDATGTNTQFDGMRFSDEPRFSPTISALDGASFYSASFQNVDFSGIFPHRFTAPGSDFTGTTFFATVFRDSDLSGSDFSNIGFGQGARGGLVFINTNLRNIRFPSNGSSFAEISGCDLTGATGNSFDQIPTGPSILIVNSICPDGTPSSSSNSPNACSGHYLP